MNLRAMLIAPVACVACWHPTPTTGSWQYQLQGRIETSVRAPIYDVDGADVPAATVAKLHGRGRRAICYFDAGSWERWRADAGRFPAAVKGRSVSGWTGERWLDVRRLDVLGPILRARMETCRGKGFDAVDPDNVNGYENRTGFPLSAADQLRFDTWVANTAHSLGLAVALKNDLGQASRLEPYFDLAVVEQCFQYRECGAAHTFVKAGKPVLAVEYALPRSRFCARSKRLRFAAVRKRLALGTWRRTCG